MRVRCYRGHKLGVAGLLLLVAGLAAGCHNNNINNTTTVTVAPTSTTLALQGTQLFSATVTNATDTTVTWQVNKVTGGTTTCGTISANGLYTAPSVLPSSTACGTITITAISNQSTNVSGTATVTLTSGITITISPTGSLTMGTTDTLPFVATVNGFGTSFVNTVNWLVNGTVGGGSTSGTICLVGTGPTSTSTPPCNPMTPGDGSTTAIYFPPGTAPGAAVTIEAQSVADTTQTASAAVMVVTAATPSLSSVSPTLIPQGALFQDIYLTGTNFLSTSQVLVSGITLTNVTRVSSTILSARIPSNLLSTAGMLTVAATDQHGNTASAAQNVTVVPVRPAALTSIPSVLLQQPVNSNAASTLEVDGGYFTPASTLQYNGQTRAATQSAQVISSISRSNGTVTATLAAALTVPGGNAAGMVTVAGVGDPSFDGTFLVLSGSGTATLGWAQAGTNASSSGGSVQVTPDPRRISATIGGLANDLTTAGLFPVAVTTPNATPPQAATNVTVRPTATPAVSNTITAQISTPVAVAYDEVLGTAVVLNQGNNTLALLDSGLTTVVNTIQVSTSGASLLTSVAVDSLHHVALVVDNGGADVQAVDLVGQALLGPTVPIPSGQGAPYAVGIDDAHQVALVVGQNSNSATLLDTGGLSSTSGPVILGTVQVSTGAKPQVTVLPELGWAIVAPGGTGSITVVDLVRSKALQQSVVVFTASLSPTMQGVALDTERKTLLLADPASTGATLFRLTDQSVGGVNLGFGNVATAVNPLTGIGLVANPGLQQAFVLDLSTSAKIFTLSLSNKTQSALALAFAAGPDKALMTDDLDNSVTVIDFGPTRATGGDPQILQLSCQPVPPSVTTGCPAVILSGPATSAVPLTVIGAGFTPNAQIRLNQTGSPVVTTTFVNSQMLTTMIPLSFLNAGPLRLIVDVENPATGGLSNVKNIYVIQTVPVGAAPAGVAVDPQRDVALVADAGANAVSVVDVNPSSPTFATVTSTLGVGTAPAGIGILTRAGRAVVANSGDSTASVLDYTTSPASTVFQVSLGAQPAGVAVDQGLGTALVTSSASNSVSTFSITATTAPQPSASATGGMPVAAAIAPDLEEAAVAAESGAVVQILDVSSGSPNLITQVTNIAQPFGVDYDPVSRRFLVLARAGNEVLTIDPTTTPPSLGAVRVGVDPSSLAYNFQSSTLLTLNTASNTLSVVDLSHSTVVDLLPLSGGSQYALAIHPRLSMAVVSDSANNRVLLLPMPR